MPGCVLHSKNAVLKANGAQGPPQLLEALFAPWAAGVSPRGVGGPLVVSLGSGVRPW